MEIQKVCLLVKVSVHHFRKIVGCLDGHYFLLLVLVFISPRCLEPVGLIKNLAENRIISILISAMHGLLIFKKRAFVKYLYK